MKNSKELSVSEKIEYAYRSHLRAVEHNKENNNKASVAYVQETAALLNELMTVEILRIRELIASLGELPDE